jgi:hypothetical protein
MTRPLKLVMFILLSVKTLARILGKFPGVSLPFNVWGRLYNSIINERETMRDTRNQYLIQMEDGRTFEMDTPLEVDQTDYLVDNYYKGRIARFWVNGVEWLEPTA